MANEKSRLNESFVFVIIQDYYKQFFWAEQKLLKYMEYLENTYIPELVKRQKQANIKQEKPFDPFYMAEPLVKDTSKYAAAVIVFAAFYLEGRFYRYGAKHLSASYYEKYLDKLDLKAKYVIIPQLVTGKKMDTSSETFYMLSETVEARNRLAHPKLIGNKKSKEEDMNKEKGEFNALTKSAHLAYKTLEAISIEFDKLNNDGKNQKILQTLFKIPPE
jgi:hypothetical protein